MAATQNIPPCNTFDWLFGQPFQAENEFTPRSQCVARIPEAQPIFVDEANGHALAHGQLRSDALAFAANLDGLGLDPQDLTTLPATPTCPRPEVAPVVLIQLPNCLPFATVLLGTWAAGLTATLASPALTSKEIAWVLQNSRPRLIVTAKSCLQAMQQAMRQQEDRAYFDSVSVYTVDTDGAYPAPSPHSAEGDWRCLLHATSTSRPVSTAARVPADAAASRTAVIFWSSGTSGRSKGVLLSHNAINFSVASLWHDADFYQGQAQRWLGYVPFFHIFGLVNVVMLAVATGATVYTMPTFKLDAVLAAIPRRSVTYLHMAPPVAVLLAKSPIVDAYAKRDANGRNAFHSVVAGVTGGAPLGHEIVVQIYERLGLFVRIGYGLSEACSVTLQRGLREADMRAYTHDTGRAHWGVELAIADPPADASRSAPTEIAGEILIRSPGLMMAYLPNGADMSATSEALTEQGWLRTGDVGTLSADGLLTITDRIKELIKVRAFQVAPAELEALLCSSPAVADAGVVGVVDASAASEFPRAYVVAADTRSDDQQLQALALQLKALVETHTARYKWLVGGIVFVSQIPKSPSGKILRRVMRDSGLQGLAVTLYPRRAQRL